jgi:hypothetical protein
MLDFPFALPKCQFMERTSTLLRPALFCPVRRIAGS